MNCGWLLLSIRCLSIRVCGKNGVWTSLSSFVVFWVLVLRFTCVIHPVSVTHSIWRERKRKWKRIAQQKTFFSFLPKHKTKCSGLAFVFGTFGLGAFQLLQFDLFFVFSAAAAVAVAFAVVVVSVAMYCNVCNLIRWKSLVAANLFLFFNKFCAIQLQWEINIISIAKKKKQGKCYTATRRMEFFLVQYTHSTAILNASINNNNNNELYRMHFDQSKSWESTRVQWPAFDFRHFPFPSSFILRFISSGRATHWLQAFDGAYNKFSAEYLQCLWNSTRECVCAFWAKKDSVMRRCACLCT